jgi:hypothetical protein
MYTTFNRVNILHSVIITYKSNRKIFVGIINKGTKYLKMLLYNKLKYIKNLEIIFTIM